MYRTLAATLATAVGVCVIGAGVAAASPGVQQPNPAPIATASVDATADWNTAAGTVGTDFGLATGVGAMVGGVAGVGLGCALGAVTAGITALPVPPAMPLVALIGCLGGAAMLGSIGPVLGGAILGVPVGVAAAAQAYGPLHAAGDIAAGIPTQIR